MVFYKVMLISPDIWYWWYLFNTPYILLPSWSFWFQIDIWSNHESIENLLKLIFCFFLLFLILKRHFGFRSSLALSYLWIDKMFLLFLLIIVRMFYIIESKIITNSKTSTFDQCFIHGWKSYCFLPFSVFTFISSPPET